MPPTPSLTVYIDYKSPYAFLAKDPTYALAAEFGITIDWLPFTLDISSYLGSARVDERGNVLESDRTPYQWTRVRYAYRDAKRYATLRGLTLKGPLKIWDSSLAAIGLLWAKAQGDAVLRGYTDRVFERFWKRELDIERPEVIEGVLAEAGAEVAGFGNFLAGEGRNVHDRLQMEIRDAGVFGVPTYVIDGELLWGREHLPLVRWILSGRRGEPPQ